MKARVLLKMARPCSTASTIVVKLSSCRTMSQASLATAVPDPIAIPMSARRRAGASFTPSPTGGARVGQRHALRRRAGEPCARTRHGDDMALLLEQLDQALLVGGFDAGEQAAVGDAERLLRRRHRAELAAGDAAIGDLVGRMEYAWTNAFTQPVPANRMAPVDAPIRKQMADAVCTLSPVTTTTRTPAVAQRRTASRTPGRGGSSMATMPTKVRPCSTDANWSGSADSTGSDFMASARQRIPCTSPGDELCGRPSDGAHDDPTFEAYFRICWRTTSWRSAVMSVQDPDEARTWAHRGRIDSGAPLTSSSRPSGPVTATDMDLRLRSKSSTDCTWRVQVQIRPAAKDWRRAPDLVPLVPETVREVIRYARREVLGHRNLLAEHLQGRLGRLADLRAPNKSARTVAGPPSGRRRALENDRLPALYSRMAWLQSAETRPIFDRPALVSAGSLRTRPDAVITWIGHQTERHGSGQSKRLVVPARQGTTHRP